MEGTWECVVGVVSAGSRSGPPMPIVCVPLFLSGWSCRTVTAGTGAGVGRSGVCGVGQCNVTRGTRVIEGRFPTGTVTGLVCSIVGVAGMRECSSRSCRCLGRGWCCGSMGATTGGAGGREGGTRMVADGSKWGMSSSTVPPSNGLSLALLAGPCSGRRLVVAPINSFTLDFSLVGVETRDLITTV